MLVPSAFVRQAALGSVNARLAKPLRAFKQPLITGSSVKPLRRAYSGAHDASDESYPVFNERYTQFFEGVQDLFELQRGLNNCFAYDLVPAVSTVEAALKAARRVNDLPTAIRIFEGLKEKVENKNQYKAYLDELQSLRDELGVPTKEELYGQAI